MKCILIDEIFYVMYVITVIITSTFLAELEVQKKAYIVLISGLELWNILMDLIAIRRKSYGFISAWLMLRHGLMEGEKGRSL
jgi:hypothetical protein